MMSAEEYQAKAESAARSAESCANYRLMLHLEDTARAWRRLAETADWQDAMLSALAATRD